MIIALVGKPSSGKSTFFKAATLAEVDIAPYPFTTIKKNCGVGFVKVHCVDREFGKKCVPKFGYCLEHWRFIPIEMIDVAGLIPGSHKGLGRGNEFLDDLRQADAFVHILDLSGSTNEKGEQVEPLSYDPLNDVRFLEEEIDLWFLGLLKKTWGKFARTIKQESQQAIKAITKQFSGLKIDEDMVKDAIKGFKPDLTVWSEADLLKFASRLRRSSKPMVIAANKADVNGAEKNLDKLKKEFPDYLIIPCSAESELALREAAKHNLIKYIPGGSDFELIDESKLNEEQLKGLKFIKEHVFKKYGDTGIQQVLDKSIFSLLKYIAVYPVENENKLCDIEKRVLPDAHLLPDGSTPLDLAFKIHTDIGNKFVAAVDARTKRRLAKDYKLKHNDVVKIMTS